MMKVSTILKRARKYIEKGWTQNAAARSAKGIPTLATSPKAAQWCIVGALDRVTSSGDEGSAAEDILVQVLPPKQLDVAEWNDAPRRTQAQVLRLFDRAIAKSEKAEQK